MVAKTAKLPTGMHIVQNRIQTFSRSIKLSAKLKVRWPHAHPVPEDLALAGFYYFPYEGADDNVCCYLCGKNMGGWEEDDDPLKEHLRGNDACAWAILRDLLVRSKNGEDLGDDVDDPRSEKMNTLRETTFDKWWPHDEKKGWNPKSKKMAKAGFYYTPTDDSDDMVNCPYCLIGLDGWEPRDDPIKEHKSRTPTCPFFVGLHSSLPTSNASSPVKSVISEPSTIPRPRQPSEEGTDEDIQVLQKTKNKRQMTRQSNIHDQDMSTDDEIVPPSKRRKSTRVTSQSSIEESTEPSPTRASRRQSSVPVKKEASPPRRKSTRPPSAPKQRAVSTVEAPIETVEEETPAPLENRRATRSGQTISLPGSPVQLHEIPAPQPTKPKGKHARTKNRQVSALSKIVSEVEKSHPRRTSRSTHPIDDAPLEKSDEPAIPETVEEPIEEPEVIAPKPKKRGRPAKLRVVEDEDDVPEVVAEIVAETRETATRRTRQSIAVATSVDNADNSVTEIAQTQEEPEEQVMEPAAAPKRKRASTRAKRSVSVAMQELPEIEETEADVVPTLHTRKSTGRSVTAPIAEIPEPEPEVEEHVEEVIPAPRGRKPVKARGKNTTVQPEPTQDILVPTKPGRRGRTASKRDISTVMDGAVDIIEPPAKRKASNLRSIQKIPTPSEDSASDIFEDSKSTFSEAEDVPKVPAKRGKSTLRNKSRAKVVVSEERETEDAPSTIYHSADDYVSSPAHSSAKGKSKREMVDTAKKELQEEIWREKVANGEVGMPGSSEDDEKENAAEEKGKKPTRTVRAKGAKGATRKAKVNGKKGKITQMVVSEDDASSVGESHALVVKAMISPLRPGPVLTEPESDVSSEDGHIEVNQAVTPVQRKILNWTPAKIDDTKPAPAPNGELASDEEEMTVEQWMRYVIGDEVKRLEEECERLVCNLEKEGNRARRLLENLV